MAKLNVIDEVNKITLEWLLRFSKEETATKEQLVKLMESRLSDLKAKENNLENSINDFLNK